MDLKVVIVIVVVGLIVAGVTSWFLYGWFESMFGLGWVGIGLSLAFISFIFGGILKAMMSAKR